jgi:hypothetical protein
MIFSAEEHSQIKIMYDGIGNNVSEISCIFRWVYDGEKCIGNWLN